MKTSVHFVSPASDTLRLALAGSQAPAQADTFSHPFMYRGETGFYDLLFSVILNKARPLAGALVELDVEVVQALSRALWAFMGSFFSQKKLTEIFSCYLPLLRLGHSSLF